MDGVDRGTYNATKASYTPQVVLYQATGLGAGKHTVRLISQPASDGQMLAIDKVEVLPTTKKSRYAPRVLLVRCTLTFTPVASARQLVARSEALSSSRFSFCLFSSVAGGSDAATARRIRASWLRSPSLRLRLCRRLTPQAWMRAGGTRRRARGADQRHRRRRRTYTPRHRPCTCRGGSRTWGHYRPTTSRRRSHIVARHSIIVLLCHSFILSCSPCSMSGEIL